jgi:A nuclease family of the HNH/ENDO VII superfamily with conserved AHH
MAKSKHITAADLEKLHKPGCLTRHQKRANGNPCSHQWQAGVKAREHPELYEVAEFPKWSPGIATNFGHFRRPYWHNAHHIIPNGSLKNAIAAQKKDAPGGLVNLIKQGLLKAEYNLNDKVNMVILPMTAYHARKLGLPRHLKGDKNETRSHPAYSKQAETKLEPIMDEYASAAADAIDEAKGKHESPDANLTKRQLEELSENLFNMICIAGSDPENLGKSLSQLSDMIFSFL